MPARTDRLPVTLLAGFLGSGKTTLVNRILTEEHGRPIAVVVNEFGEVGVDGRLVLAAEEDVVELANGCVCCSVREDLRLTLHRLAKKRGRFERVLIEASGMASPGPAVQTLRIDPELEATYALGNVVTLAHAAEIAAQLDSFPEAADQVGYGDLLLLNHADRCDDAALTAAREALGRCNAQAPILTCERADAPLSEVLGEPQARATTRLLPAGVRTHTSGVGTVRLRTRAALDLHRLKMWLQFLATRRTHQILRMKGLLRCVDHARPVLVQSVYQWLEIGPLEGEAPEESALVLIGRDLDPEELQRGWEAAGARQP